jgi:hypothetical protein
VPGWGKIGGKNRHDLRAFGGGYTRRNSAVFWQTGHFKGIFSTRRGKDSFTGFSGIGPGTGGRKGARIGLISSTPISTEISHNLYAFKLVIYPYGEKRINYWISRAICASYQ